MLGPDPVPLPVSSRQQVTRMSQSNLSNLMTRSVAHESFALQFTNLLSLSLSLAAAGPVCACLTAWTPARMPSIRAPTAAATSAPTRTNSAAAKLNLI